MDGELLTIELTPEPPKTVRWPLAATEIAPPSPGTAVELLPGPPDRGRSVEAALPTGARIEAGFLVADDVTPGGPRVYALTADGAIARVDPPDEGDLGHQARFRPARRVEVTVVDEGGAPVEGAVVGLRRGGYQEMVEPTPTDANGEVRFERLYPALLSVTLIPPGESSRYARGNEVQSVNLERRGRGRHDHARPADARALRVPPAHRRPPRLARGPGLVRPRIAEGRRRAP